MNDTAATGAAAAGTPGDATATAAANGSAAATAPDLLSGLQDAESRQWVESKGYKDLGAIVSDARYADKLKAEVGELKGKALTPPAPDATPEQWAAFYGRLGRPEKAEGYEFALPANLPEGLPYDGESAKAYKQWSHDAGLTPRQAQALHDRFVEHSAGQYAAQQAALSQRAETAHGELVKVWGEPASDTYKANVTLANRFIANNGGEALLAELKAVGAMHPSGAVLSPNLAKAFANAGKAYREDGLVTGSESQPQRSVAETFYPPDRDPFKRA